MKINERVFIKVIKMQSWKAWVKRPVGLIKSRMKFIAFKRGYLDKGDNVL